ncbi:uncharacterized protein LOC134769116 [Penaeus indicus]|uniref:uncharacterized protein LOC134769116 n=1 Tax=Penaeus indicus TaxID=29960 RepID=UPI00300D5270
MAICTGVLHQRQKPSITLVETPLPTPLSLYSLRNPLGETLAARRSSQDTGQDASNPDRASLQGNNALVLSCFFSKPVSPRRPITPPSPIEAIMEPFTAGILAVGGMIAVMLAVVAAQENNSINNRKNKNKSRNKAPPSPRAEQKTPEEKRY